VPEFYGNCTVYAADGNRVRAFDKYNFNVESSRGKAWGDYWVTDEVIVALGSSVSRKKALKFLRHVVKRIELEMAKARRLK
jgi:hypothetical protein